MMGVSEETRLDTVLPVHERRRQRDVALMPIREDPVGRGMNEQDGGLLLQSLLRHGAKIVNLTHPIATDPRDLAEPRKDLTPEFYRTLLYGVGDTAILADLLHQRDEVMVPANRDQRASRQSLYDGGADQVCLTDLKGDGRIVTITLVREEVPCVQPHVILRLLKKAEKALVPPMEVGAVQNFHKTTQFPLKKWGLWDSNPESSA